MAKNEVTLDLVIRTLVDGNTKDKAKQQGEDFASEYQKALEAVLKLAKSNDFTLDAKIGKDVLKQLEELSKQTDKTLKTQIEKAKGYLDQWVKYQSNIPSLDLFGKVNANKPKTDKKGSTNSDNVTPTVSFKGLDEGLQKAEKSLDSFLEKFKKFCTALQTEANKTIKLKGLSDGLTEGKKAIGEASKVKLKFDGINEGVNSAKSKLQELVDFFKEKIALLPKIASTRISFKGLDTGVKTKIADILQGANKAFDAFSKKATEMPQKFDAAVSKLATSLARLEAGINGLIVVFSKASTKITANIENIPQSFNKLQDAIKLTSRMLRDMGKNTGKNVTTQLRQISNEIKSFGKSISNLGSAIPNKLVNSLNQVAAAIGKMESLVIRLNNTFKNFDTKPFDNVKNKIKDIEKLFSTINGLASNLGKNAGSPMYSALSGIQKKLRGVITLLREAQKEAANFGNAFSGNYLASLNQLRSALNGIHARLRVIGRMTFPNIPNVPNVPNAPNTPNVPNAPNQPRRQSGGGTSSNNAVTGFGGAIKKATGALSSFYDSIIKFNVMYYGIPNILNTLTAPFQSGFEYQKSMETSKLGIAGILTQMGKVDGEKLTFQDSLGVAEGILQRLNLQAIRTAASTKDLVETFRGLAAPGLGAGFNIEQLEKFTVVGVNAAKSMGLDSRQFIQELRDLIQGGIQPASSTIATSLGLTDADIKAMKESSKGLFASLMEYMEGTFKAAEYFPKTLEGMIDQITEYSTLASAEVTKALEPEIKNIMQIIQNLFGEIKLNENGIPIKFEINPAILSFINTLHTGIRQVTVLWNEFLSAVGSFDSDGKFIITEQGTKLLESACQFAKTLWSIVLQIGLQLVDMAPVIVDIVTDIFTIANYALRILGALSEMLNPLKWIAENWEDIKGKVYGVIVFLAVINGYLKTMIILEKIILGISAFWTMARNAGSLANMLKVIIPLMTGLISKTKALAAWNAILATTQAIAQNPKAALAALGLGVATVASAEAGARIAGGSLVDVFSILAKKVSSFADDIVGDVNVKLPEIPEIPEKDTSKSDIDPSTITGDTKPPDGKEAQRAADKAEKERLKLAKKALKEMLSALDAHLKEQISILKEAMERTDVLYKQNQMGWQTYSEERIKNELSQKTAEAEIIRQKIEAIKSSDSFDNEDDRQNQLNPLIEKLGELERAIAKSTAAYTEVTGVISRFRAVQSVRDKQLAKTKTQIGTNTPEDAYGDFGQWIMHYGVEVLGMSKERVAGLVGNLKQETNGFDPKEISDDGAYTKGIGQWDANRYAKMVAWATEKGMDPLSKKAQAIYVLLENQTLDDYEISQWKRVSASSGLTASSSPEEYAYVYSKANFRPGEPMMENRKRYARETYDNYKETTPAIDLSSADMQSFRAKAVARGREIVASGATYADYVCTTFVKEMLLKSGLEEYLNQYGRSLNEILDNWVTEKYDVDGSTGMVGKAKRMGVLEKYIEGMTLSPGDIMISAGAGGNAVSPGHTFMYSGNGKVLDSSGGNGERTPIWEIETERKKPLYVIRLANVLDKMGIATEDFTDSAVLYTQQALETEDKLRKAEDEMRNVKSEYDEILGNVSSVKLDKLNDEYNHPKYGIIQKLTANGYQNEAGMASNLFEIKKNRIKFKQSEEYINRALDIVKDNAETLMYSIGNSFLDESSKLAEMSDKYLSYMASGGNYPYGEFDLAKNIRKMEEYAKKAWQEGDTKTYLEIKSTIKKVKDTLIGFIDDFQAKVKDVAQWAGDMLNESGLTEGQKEVYNHNINAKLYTNLAQSETMKAKELTANNEKQILEYKEKIANLDKRSATYASDLANYQQEISRLQSDPTVEQYWRNVALYTRKAKNEARDMKNTFREIRLAAKQALEDGLVTFLTDGINECETLADALNDLAVSILKTLQKKFAENLVNDMMNAWFPDDKDNPAVPTSPADAALQGLAMTAAFTAEQLNLLAQSINNVIGSTGQPNQIPYYPNDWQYTASAGDANSDTTLKVDAAQTEQSMITLSAGATEANTSVGMFSSTLSTEMTTIQGALTEFTTNVQSAASSLLSIGSGGGSGVQQNANGGYISGPGTGTSDSILSRLSNGEFVVKAASVRKYGTSMLERINNGTFSNVRVALPAFASGGYVGSLVGAGDGIADRLSQSFSSNVSVTNYVDGTKMVNPEVIKTIVRKVNLQDAKRNSQIMSRFK